MKQCLWICVVVLGITGCASQSQPTPDAEEKPKQVLNYAKADQDYIALAQRIINRQATGDDFDRIYKLFSLTSYYQPTDKFESRIKQASASYMRDNQWFDCIRENSALINQNYTSLTGHYGMAICSQEARDDKGAEFHNWVLDNFIEAIWRTGDGQSADSAFYINSVLDLIAFVQLHQLQIISQKLIYNEQRPIQHVRVQNPENKREYDWYFDMTAQFRKAYIEQLESS